MYKLTDSYFSHSHIVYSSTLRNVRLSDTHLFRKVGGKLLIQSSRFFCGNIRKKQTFKAA